MGTLSLQGSELGLWCGCGVLFSFFGAEPGKIMFCDSARKELP